MSAQQVAGQLLMVAGALFFSTAGLGLLRLKDAYARSSAVATAAGLGISLVLLGAFVQQPSWGNLAKLAVAVLLQLATSAAGSMAIARSAYLTGSPLHCPSGQDDLARADSVDPTPPEPGPPGRDG